MMSSDGFLLNVVSREQVYSQRVLEISLPHRFLSQNDRKCMERDRRSLTSAWKKIRPVSFECDIKESDTVSVEPIVNEIVSWLWGHGTGGGK
ncbi:hypothetical protein AVEN_111419-1 [Araneus ventricosus]|uniref:Uncharacterized protein n=1 Tax=Araneus ventricosus TaxID=182803 RepID=A0A4Y2UK84_ARAVE|nr:hypothetical protein AVEN_191278-1 [Araneus ventricosus]GBO13288.1 hypothetical protein AVEN_111419-1 [Araneus ventricosus]